MPRPICCRCNRQMQWEKAVVVEMRADMLGDKPYEQWRGDLARCPGCGAEFVARFADQRSWVRHRGAEGYEKPDYSIPERSVHHA